jgi:predicted DCC family thiol-disulfide oxidoreductase YuxK
MTQVKTTVIYDGDCEFCKSCVQWVANRYEIKSIPNQEIDDSGYLELGITKEQCQKSVVVIETKPLFGAQAVSVLLKRSGHSILGALLKLSGPIGELGYRYVASHREGRLVAALHALIKKSK